MKVAVTGASGFVGGTLCRAIAAAGHRLARLDAREPVGLHAIEGSEVVVHLAAIAHRPAHAAADLWRVNVELAEQVGRKAAALGARMIFMSSVKVHGDESEAPFREDSPFAPADEYGESKARAEERLRAIAGLALTVLRPPLVYGPGVKANFLALLKAVAVGIPLPLRNIANRRSLVFVDNLAHAVLLCLEQPLTAANCTFLISDGPAVSTPDLCRELGIALGRPARLVPFPRAVLELIPGAKRLTRSLEVNDSAIRRKLGWEPAFTRQAGLQVTADWYRLDATGRGHAAG